MKLKILSTIIKLFALTGIALLAFYMLQDNQTPDESDAIFGGELEEGYPSAGFLISESIDGYFNYCGIVNVGNNRAFTAAHCVDRTQGVSIGFGKFTDNSSEELEIRTVYRNTGWNSEDVNEDFAVIEYSKDSDTFISTALAVAPAVGCNYYVVGYGRTGELGDSELTSRPRKSGKVCIENIEEKVVYITGDESGICLGDSGSPIFKEDSNQVVAVISSIITTPENQLTPCFIGNSAIGVRVDQKLREFNQLASEDLIDDSGIYQTLDFIEPVSDFNIPVESSIVEDIKAFALEQDNLVTFLLFVLTSLSASYLLVQLLKSSRKQVKIS